MVKGTDGRFKWSRNFGKRVEIEIIDPTSVQKLHDKLERRLADALEGEGHRTIAGGTLGKTHSRSETRSRT